MPPEPPPLWRLPLRSLGLGIAAFVVCSLTLHARTLWEVVVWPERVGEVDHLIALTDMLGLGAWAGALHISTVLARRSGARVRWFLLMAGVWSLAVYPVLSSGVLLRPTGPGGDLPTAWMDTFKSIAPAWWPGTLFGALCWSGMVPLLAVGLLRQAPRRPPAWAQTLAAAIATLPGLFLMSRQAYQIEHWDRFRPLLLLGAPLAVAVVAWGERWLDALAREPQVDPRRRVPTLIRFARAAQPASWARSAAGWGAVALAIAIGGSRHAGHFPRLAVERQWDRVLAAMGPVALPAVQEALESEHVETRRWALCWVCSRPELRDLAITALEEALADPAGEVRRAAVVEADRLQSGRPSSLLARRLAAVLTSDPDAGTRRSAASALFGTDEPGPLDALEQALHGDAASEVRASAASALFWGRPRVTTERLIEEVGRQSAVEVRGTLVGLLATRSLEPPAFARLWELAHDEQPRVAHKALTGLFNASPQAAWSCLEDLARTSPGTCPSALARFGEGSYEPLREQALFRALGAADRSLRRAAAAVIVQEGRSGTTWTRDLELVRSVLILAGEGKGASSPEGQ